MARFSVAKYVEAPPSVVFALFTDFERAPERTPGVTRLEVLTPGPTGIGTRFRETRKVFGHVTTEELEVTSLYPGQSFELRCRTGGSEYRSRYRFSPQGPGTLVEVEFESEPMSLAAKLMSPVASSVASAIKKCVEQDLEDMKRYAERHAAVA